MDAIAATVTRLLLAVLVFGSGGVLDRSAPERPLPALAIHGAEPDEARDVRWALSRFETGGLDGLPLLEVHLHGATEACNGWIGRYRAGRIDLCTAESSSPYARKFALHEMAHAWVGENVDDETRDRFLRLRGVSAWNGWDIAWKERGTEQAAEIIAWGLGEGEIAPLLPERADASQLVEAYVLLTGRRPIAPVTT